MSAALGLFVIALLVLATALFVAAEFAVVAARRGVLEEQAAAGSRRARAALVLIRRLSFTLSAAQLGITAAALILGYVAESAVASILGPVIGVFGLEEDTARVVTLGVALLVSTVLAMVIGELVPKNIAFARPEATLLAVSLPFGLYATTFAPLIRIFDGTANRLSRVVGVEPREEMLDDITPEELARIISASTQEGALPEDQAELLMRAVELGERRVAEVMVPRPDVAWLNAGDPIGALREAARTTGHSRFPVRAASGGDVVGTVHIKDLLRGTDAEVIGDIMTPPVIVPESTLLRRLLADLRQRRRTFAVVVDEFGDVTGIVTLEDVLEELVGEIEDEFDPQAPALRRVGAGRFIVPGSMRVDRLQSVLGTEIPEGDYETAAGFVIERLGRIPDVGDDVEYSGWRLVVTRVDGHRVAELVVERVPSAAASAPPAGGVT